MDDAQLEQERQYNFPYHHVGQYRNGFKASYYVRYALKHISSLEWIISKIHSIPFKSLCDLGCGDGRLVTELDHAFPSRHIVGLDYSVRSIHLAKGIHPTGDFRQVDIFNDPIQEQFDLVTLIEVFEHIPVEQCEQFAKKTAGLIKPNGYLLITVPHQNLPISKKHFQHFTQASLWDYFQSDFELEEVQFLEKRGGSRLYWYYRLLKNKMFILNNQSILNWIYKGYKKHLLIADSEQDCERLYFLLKKKT